MCSCLVSNSTCVTNCFPVLILKPKCRVCSVVLTHELAKTVKMLLYYRTWSDDVYLIKPIKIANGETKSRAW